MPIETHAKKRIDIIVETPVERRITALLESLGVKGYTVMPVIGGSGQHGHWSRSGMVGNAGQMVLVFCVLDESEVDRVLERIFALVERQIGIVTVSDVAVVRSEHF